MDRTRRTAREHDPDSGRATATIETPIGPVSLAASANALVAVSFGGDRTRTAPTNGPTGNTLLDEAAEQLLQYFAGARHRFDLPLALGSLTPFRREILQRTAKVPFGETISYGALAAAVGRDGASRAVGTAQAGNPLAIVIPCHRVIRSDGSIGRYAGGEQAKRWLLEHEGASVTF